MNDIWLISDTHFNHNNITLFDNYDGSPARINPQSGRRFESVEQMNELMIDRWNDRIKTHDKVWHLGDVIMGPKSQFSRYLSRLNGKKRMLLGNHDTIKGTSLIDFFEKVELWRIFKEHGFICTHVPIHVDEFRGKCKVNVHGHVHNNDMKESHYLNICVEKTSYYPIHIDEVIQKVRKI